MKASRLQQMGLQQTGARAWALLRALLCALLLLPLTACDAGPHDPRFEGAPSPAIWAIAGPDGETRGWLLGTIHALPDGVSWESPAIRAARQQANMLVVEVRDLDDRAGLRRTYTTLAVSPGLAPLLERMPEGDARALRAAMAKAGVAPHDLDGMETWAAALALARQANPADSGNGVDLALIESFDGRPVIGLETAAGQLALFDRLPEVEQQDLLRATVEDIETRHHDPLAIASAWRRGDLKMIEEEGDRGILADAELREVLLTRRNAAWLTRLDEILHGEAKPLVAVGTAHLVGPDGLVEALRKRGYMLTRL